MVLAKGPRGNYGLSPLILRGGLSSAGWDDDHTDDVLCKDWQMKRFSNLLDHDHDNKTLAKYFLTSLVWPNKSMFLLYSNRNYVYRFRDERVPSKFMR